MSSGIKITKRSKSVTKSNIEDFYVNSDTPLFKLYKEINGVYRRPSVILSGFTIPHNLGYEPFYILFMDRLPGSRRKIVTNFDELLDAGQLLVTATTDDRKIETNLSGGVANAEYAYKCYIYYDRATNG